ncbi:MAG: GFA family protein [Coxiellaceae bacterium]|nr:GFA family protein [Coxiellaceae bacterium]
MTKHCGKCFCSENSFEIDADPEFQFICYCSECRELNSGGHLCGMLFDAAQLTEAANTKTFEYKGGSGEPIIMHFCPTCSTQLYGYPTKYAGKVVVRANTIKNSNFKPQQMLFEESKFDWDQ